MSFNLKGINTATWVRIVALFLVLVNQIAISMFEVQLLPFTDAEIYEGVSTVVTIIVSLITSWKNNSISQEAQEADEVLKAKKGNI